jgi:hypothetical protein
MEPTNAEKENHMLRLTYSSHKLLNFSVLLLLLGLAPKLSAQANTKACDPAAPAAPCLNQPRAGQTQITGKITVGATADLQVAGNLKGKPPVASDGSFTMEVSALKQGDTVTLTENSSGKTATLPVAAALVTTSGTSSSLYTLGLVGLNATGTSSSGPSQQYFASFDVTAPVPLLGSYICKPSEADYPLAQRCWVWMNPRIASAPSASTTALSTLTSPTSVASGISNMTVGQITQTFEFHAAFEYALSEPYLGRQFGWTGSWGRSSVSLIAGGGIVTPFNSVSNASEFSLNDNLGQQFNSDPSLAKEFPQLAAALCAYGYAGTTTTPCLASATTAVKDVAFVLPSRSRFYRDYFAGLRFKTYYFSGDCKEYAKNPTAGESKTSPCKIQNTYPGTLDLRFGQDESVTGGHLRSVVMSISGSYPVPGTSGILRLYGSAYLRLRGNRNSPTLILLPTSPLVALNDPSVVIQPTSQSDQDFYRLGIGADLIALISKWFTASSQKSGTGN